MREAWETRFLMWSVEAATRLDDLEYEDTEATIRITYLCISEVNCSAIC
jgi:hypothetical protein